MKSYVPAGNVSDIKQDLVNVMGSASGDIGRTLHAIVSNTQEWDDQDYLASRGSTVRTDVTECSAYSRPNGPGKIRGKGLALVLQNDICVAELWKRAASEFIEFFLNDEQIEGESDALWDHKSMIAAINHGVVQNYRLHEDDFQSVATVAGGSEAPEEEEGWLVFVDQPCVMLHGFAQDTRTGEEHDAACLLLPELDIASGYPVPYIFSKDAIIVTMNHDHLHKRGEAIAQTGQHANEVMDHFDATPTTDAQQVMMPQDDEAPIDFDDGIEAADPHLFEKAKTDQTLRDDLNNIKEIFERHSGEFTSVIETLCHTYNVPLQTAGVPARMASIGRQLSLRQLSRPPVARASSQNSRGPGVPALSRDNKDSERTAYSQPPPRLTRYATDRSGPFMISRPPNFKSNLSIVVENRAHSARTPFLSTSSVRQGSTTVRSKATDSSPYGSHGSQPLPFVRNMSAMTAASTPYTARSCPPEHGGKTPPPLLSRKSVIKSSKWKVKSTRMTSRDPHNLDRYNSTYSTNEAGESAAGETDEGERSGHSVTSKSRLASTPEEQTPTAEALSPGMDYKGTEGNRDMDPEDIDEFDFSETPPGRVDLNPTIDEPPAIPED